MENKSNSSNTSQRDGLHESLWQEHPIETQLPNASTNSDKIFDVLIIGGGITGVTTALMLQKKGMKCILAEGANIGFGSTGGTTAHLNTFFDSPYNIIEENFGESNAKLVAQSGKDALSLIAKNVYDYNINCDFEYKDSFIYAQTDQEVVALKKIFTATKNSGIEVEEVDEINVPIDFLKAIKIPKQAQFHPLKYIDKLAEEFTKLGGVIMENTFITNTKFKNGVHEAFSDLVTIKANHLFYATHLPPGINIFSFSCAPYRSYVLCIRLNDDNYPKGLAYDMEDPYHYYRSHVISGKTYLILGGEDHKTGHDSPEESFKNLEIHARQHFNVESIDFRWSSQYYTPVDGLPYIGEMPIGENTYLATGYDGNGMTFGTLAATIISDLIANADNQYADLYKPSRLKPIAGFTEFVKENADVVYRFIADRFGEDNVESLNQIEPNCGKIIKYEDKKIAVYKDSNGQIHALNPTCTHVCCIVNWNNEEKSWDCPCHGGRFDKDGKVLCGPPLKGLEKIEI